MLYSSKHMKEVILNTDKYERGGMKENEGTL